MSTYLRSITALGRDFNKLSGEDNYDSWVKAFKLIAYLEGVWALYTGEKAVLSRPVEPTPDLITEKFTTRSSRHPTDDDIVAQECTDSYVTNDRNAYEEYKIRLLTYNLKLDKYIENREQVRYSRALLVAAVEPFVYEKIISKINGDPRAAWNSLAAAYESSPRDREARAVNQLNNLVLEDPADIDEYAGIAEDLFDNIINAGGNLAWGDLIDHITRALPRQYNYFNKHWNRFVGTTTNSINEYKTFRYLPLKYAEDNKAKWATQHTKNKDRQKKKRRRCYWCQILGHVEKDCRKKAAGHPKVEPKDY
jgi:hypothetical protein